MHHIMTVKKRMGDKLRMSAHILKCLKHLPFQALQRCLHLERMFELPVVTSELVISG